MTKEAIKSPTGVYDGMGLSRALRHLAKRYLTKPECVELCNMAADALDPFADYANTWHEDEPDNHVCCEGYDDDDDVTLGEFRAARGY